MTGTLELSMYWVSHVGKQTANWVMQWIHQRGSGGGEAVPLSIYNPQPNNGLVVIGGDLSCMGTSKCISINHILALHAYQNYVKQEKILILPKFQPKKKTT